MLTKRILYLRGLGKAMMTPFTDDASKSVDYDRLRKLIRRQIEGCKLLEMSEEVTSNAISVFVVEWI